MQRFDYTFVQFYETPLFHNQHNLSTCAISFLAIISVQAFGVMKTTTNLLNPKQKLQIRDRNINSTAITTNQFTQNWIYLFIPTKILRIGFFIRNNDLCCFEITHTHTFSHTQI